MLNGFNGLGCGPNMGCSCQFKQFQGFAGLGALTEADFKKFFIGDNLYTRSTIKVAVYTDPGAAPLKFVNAGEVLGKVTGFNSKLNWAKLDDGNWISLAPSIVDHYYTTKLDKYVPDTPSAIAKDAVQTTKDVVSDAYDAIPFLPSAATLKLVLWAGLAVGGAILVTRFWPKEKHAAAAA